MKWVGCPNHNIQQHLSEKPSDLPTTATVTVSPSIYQGMVASIIWLPAAVECAETLYIHLK